MPKRKAMQDLKNKRTFYLTDSNLNTLRKLSTEIFTEVNMTKLVNYAIHTHLTPLLNAINEAKTPAQIDKVKLNLIRGIIKYASNEKSIR